MVFLVAHSLARALICRAEYRTPARPIRVIWHAVLFAEHIIRPLVKADGVLGDVIFIVQIFGQPDMGNGQGHGIAGIGSRGEPFVAEQTGGMVHKRIDKDHLDAEFLQPEAPGCGFEGGIDAMGCLRIRGPEDNHLGILERIFEQVVLLRDAKPPGETPLMHATPVPAFPAVRVVVRVGVADQIHKTEIGAVAIADIAPQMM